jgi:hypothetical protein
VRIDDDKVDLLDGGFLACLHDVFAVLANEKTVLLEVFADNGFVNGGHKLKSYFTAEARRAQRFFSLRTLRLCG